MIKLLVYVILIGFPLIVSAQNTFQITIEKNDSTSPSSPTHSITETANGEIYAMSTMSPGGSYNKIRVVKLSNDGTLLWDKTYTQTPEYEFFPEIMPAHDGGVIVGALTMSYIIDDKDSTQDILVWKINQNGIIEWQQVLSTISFEDMFSTKDSGYLFLGQIREEWSNRLDIIVYKTDLNGNVLWSKQLGQPYVDDDASSLKEIDGQIYVCGNKSLSGWSDFDGVLYGLDTSGNLLWDISIEHTSEQDYFIYDILKFNDRYYFRADDIYEINPRTGNYWSVQDNTEFVVSGYDFLCGFDKIVAVRGISPYGYYFRLFETLEGFYFDKFIPGISGSFVKMIATHDGGSLILTGDGDNMQITKTDCLGNVDHWSQECNSKIPEDKQLLVYPNPSENELRIEATFDFNEVVIFSPNGQYVSYNNPCSCPRQTLDISELAAGVYVVRISSDENFAVSKFVKI